MSENDDGSKWTSVPEELQDEYQEWERLGYSEYYFLTWRMVRALPNEASPDTRMAFGDQLYGTNDSYVMKVAERCWRERNNNEPPTTLLMISPEEAERWWEFAENGDVRVVFPWLRWELDPETAAEYWNANVRDGAAAYALKCYEMTPQQVKQVRMDLFPEADMETLVRYATGED